MGSALLVLPVLLAAARPAEAFPGLSVVYTRKDAGAGIYDGRPGLPGLSDAFRQAPIAGDDRWAAIWQAGKVNGRELAHMGAEQMAATLRREWERQQVGDLVAVDELVARDWTPARARNLSRALQMLGPDARRVVFYVGPSLVSQVGRADLRYRLLPRLAAVVAALRRAGAVQLEMYQGGGIPWSRAQFAAYATRWLERFKPGDPGKLHLLFGPARVGGITQAELWHRARSTPAGRRLLANGAGVWGLQTAEEGIAWLQGYRDYLADPAAPPPGGDVAVPTGGGLGLAASGERMLTLRLSRPARAVVALRPLRSKRVRVIAKAQGPITPRRIRLPGDIRPGRYRVRAVAQGDGLTDRVEIPFRVAAPRAQSVPDPRIQTARGEPAAARLDRAARRAELLRRLITLDGPARALFRDAARCPAASPESERAQRLRAVEGAVLDAPAGLEARVAVLAAVARRLEAALRRCGQPAPSPPGPAAPVPPAPALPAVPAGPVLRAITLAQVIAGTPLDLAAELGPQVLPDPLAAVDLAALGGPACRSAGAVCLGLDRALLDRTLRDLDARLPRSFLDLLLGKARPVLPSGDLSQHVLPERLGPRSLRLALAGPLAPLAGVAGAQPLVVGQLQVVPAASTGAALAPAPPPGGLSPGASPAERRLLAAVNRARAGHGRRALRGSALLARPARRHSAALIRLGYLTHLSGGGPFWTRLVAGGFSPKRRMGENLAQISGCDPSGAEQAVQAWLRSPPHRANLLSPAFRFLGAGATSDRGCTRTVYNADFGG